MKTESYFKLFLRGDSTPLLLIMGIMVFNALISFLISGFPNSKESTFALNILTFQFPIFIAFASALVSACTTLPRLIIFGRSRVAIKRSFYIYSSALCAILSISLSVILLNSKLFGEYMSNISPLVILGVCFLMLYGLYYAMVSTVLLFRLSTLTGIINVFIFSIALIFLVFQFVLFIFNDHTFIPLLVTIIVFPNGYLILSNYILDKLELNT